MSVKRILHDFIAIPYTICESFIPRKLYIEFYLHA